MFFMLSVKPLCSIVLLPFSAILTNPILFIFHDTQQYYITAYLMLTYSNAKLTLTQQFSIIGGACITRGGARRVFLGCDLLCQTQ